MTIQFFPLGIPISSSFAVRSTITQNTSTGGFPPTASIADYIITYVGPTGSVYETVNASGLI